MNDDYILKSVREAFNSYTSKSKKPWQSEIYIFFLIKSGILLYHDTKINNSVLHKLIKEKKVKHEAIDAYHQGEKAIRYRFIGYRYPPEYYRSIPKELKEKVMDRDNNSCVKCGTYHRLTIDHIIPWSLGGITSFGNLQVLCRSCNSKKSNN